MRGPRNRFRSVSNSCTVPGLHARSRRGHTGDGLVPSRAEFVHGPGAGDHKGRPYNGPCRITRKAERGRPQASPLRVPCQITRQTQRARPQRA